MTTANEFVKSGITGQTFREIREKFGKSIGELGAEHDEMANYAVAFAWFRDREHLPLPAAWDKAMGCTLEQIEALFEDASDPAVKAVADFDSQPHTTTP